MSRRIARVVVTSAALIGGLLVSIAPAQAVTSHRALDDTRPAGAAPVSVGFAIEYFGVVADLPAGVDELPAVGRAPYGEVRFLHHGRWSAWQAVDQDGAQAAGHFTGALVTADRAEAYQVRGLPATGRNWRAAAINTTDGPTFVVGHRPAGAAQAANPCRSRADWGADESITAWSKGTDTQAFYPAQVLTVHHTAGSNDINQDYSATVRAIYTYHVETNGWSDIGYQYLIDGHGVVYEGRNSGHTSVSCLTAGGDGSDFAHQTSTDYVVNGAHVANYNAGNVGVALMGCFDNANGCTGNTTPTTESVNGLDDLLAKLSTRHGLDPQGTVHYLNPVNGYTKDIATISGHRDWEATACPGGNLYAQLPSIRADVASRMGGTTPPPPTAPAAITSASCSGATCSFTGTGSGTLSWNFGSLSAAPVSATGSSVSTTYGASGSFVVTLTDGNTTHDARTVTCKLSKNKRRTLACSAA